MENFGKAIQTLRKMKGYTQSDLAASLNVSGQAVSKWENNLSQPDLSTMREMVKIFGVSWDQFIALCEGDGATWEKVQENNREIVRSEIAAAAAAATKAADSAVAAA